MNVKRYTARTSRDALALVRQALGEDAVVLSTRPCADGVEVLAMAPDGLKQIDQAATTAPLVQAPAAAAAPAVPAATASRAKGRAAPPAPAAGRAGLLGRIEPRLEPTLDMPPAAEPTTPVEHDVQQLAMSTLSFQDYVRERMHKRREQAAASAVPAAEPVAAAPLPAPAAPLPAPPLPAPPAPRAAMAAPVAQVVPVTLARAARPEPPVLRDEVEPPAQVIRLADVGAAAARDRHDMLAELRSMKGLIEERFGALAFMEKLQRNPRQATLSQRLMDAGFSPALARRLVDSLPADAADEITWAAGVLERNLATDEHDTALEDSPGVYALIGSTGVGKTTGTAKIAAAFATRHGAGNLGLITLDAYRVAAHEQLRAYGRILGVPVHTAHDRASLEDLLGLLGGKKMVLIDTAGMAQRDARTRELLDMLRHPSIQKLLVVNAAQQGETIEDVMVSWRVNACRGVILSKLDEAVKLAPALDALIRHKVKVLGVANGQRVPEDWHHLSAHALVQRALRGGGSAAWRLDAAEVNLVFAAVHQGAALRGSGPAALAHNA